MAKHKKLSKDQKRKAKLTERARRIPSHGSPLAYTGNKYKKGEFVPIVFRTELGIHEADAVSEGRLTDAQVQAALERLIVQLREGPVPEVDDLDEVPPSVNDELDLIEFSIRRNWQLMVDEGEHPGVGTGTLVGVVRTILGSLDSLNMGRESRGYLTFLQGFMRRLGATVRVYSKNDLVSEDRPLRELPTDQLQALGREWCFDGDPQLGEEFVRDAERRIAAGDARAVAEMAQDLLGEFGGGPDDPVTVTLSRLALEAQDAMRTQLP